MIPATVVASLVAGVAGTVLQLVVFDLEEQQLLPEAGAWGTVAGVCLLALMAAPALLGVVLGVRARRLGERRLGGAGIVANALVAVYLVATGAANLLLG